MNGRTTLVSRARLSLVTTLAMIVAFADAASASDLSAQCAASLYSVGDKLTRWGPPPDGAVDRADYAKQRVKAVYVVLGPNKLRCPEGAAPDWCKAHPTPPAVLRVAGWLYAVDDARDSSARQDGEHRWYWYARDYEPDTPLGRIDQVIGDSLATRATRCP